MTPDKESQTRHTPRPWKFRPDANYRTTYPMPVVYAAIHPDGEEEAFGGIIAAFPTLASSAGEAREEDLANAHLITVAPELLEACCTAAVTIRGMIQFMKERGIRNTWGEDANLADVDAAISKATGGAL